MFQRIIGFCRRLFNSNGFQRGLRIFFWLYIASYLIGVIHYLIVVTTKTGVSFGDALRFLLFLPFYTGHWILTAASIALGIALGIAWYFNRKKKNSEKAEPDEKAEEPSNAVQEEEIIEPTHYMYH